MIHVWMPCAMVTWLYFCDISSTYTMWCNPLYIIACTVMYTIVHRMHYWKPWKRPIANLINLHIFGWTLGCNNFANKHWYGHNRATKPYNYNAVSAAEQPHLTQRFTGHNGSTPHFHTQLFELNGASIHYQSACLTRKGDTHGSTCKLRIANSKVRHIA